MLRLLACALHRCETPMQPLMRSSPITQTPPETRRESYRLEGRLSVLETPKARNGLGESSESVWSHSDPGLAKPQRDGACP